MRALQVAHAVEPGEDLEVLPHGQAHRHVDVGALEIHAVQHLVALARHVGAEHARLAGGRDDEAHQHGDGGGLAGAVAAQQRRDRAARKREADAVDGGDVAIDLAQLPHVDGRRQGRHCSCDIGFCIGRGSLEGAANGPRVGRLPARAASPLSGIARRARQASRRAAALAGGSERSTQCMTHGAVRTTQEGSEREPAAAADRRAAALVRRGRPAGDRVLRLSGAGLSAAVRHLPGVHRAVGLAQRLPAHPLSRPHPPRHRARHLSAGLRHPPALGAALSDGRHREPLHVPAGRAGDGVCRHAAAAQHHRARAARRCRHRAAGCSTIMPLPWFRGLALRSAACSTRWACWPRCCRA